MDQNMLLKNAVVYRDDFEPASVNLEVNGERITSVDAADAAGEALDLTGCTVMPGFMDIHVHGCAGCDMGDGTPEALHTMSEHLLHKGITSFCPTSMTLGADTLARLFANVAGCMGNEPGAYIQGINMEGPYISPEQKGCAECVLHPSAGQGGVPPAVRRVRRHHPCGGYRPGGAGRRGIHP